MDQEEEEESVSGGHQVRSDGKWPGWRVVRE